MTYLVETDQLTKTYGDRTVVENLDLRVPAGSVYGFLGPNGSGKSTTMKMLLNLIQPSAGSINIMGQPMTRGTRRGLLGHIGSLIENPPGYSHLTGRENMAIVQRLSDLSSLQIDRAVHAVKLEQQMDKKVKNYSLGMKQRLGIAMALAKEPSLLILDEPTNGLDPAGIEEIRQLLHDLSQAGVTVMVSSHLLGEIDKTATHLGILSNGQMIFQGSREELFASTIPNLLVRCSQPRQAQEVLAHSAGVQHSSEVLMTPTESGPVETVRISNMDDVGTAQAVATLVRQDIAVFDVRREEQNLEDLFMNLTHQGGL